MKTLNQPCKSFWPTRFTLLIVGLVITSFLFVSCKKEGGLTQSTFKNIEESQGSSFGRTSTVDEDQIKDWLDKQIGATSYIKNDIIAKILANSIFERMTVESFNDDENIIVVPLIDDYFSQHVDLDSTLPLQYAIFIEDKEGEIRRGDLALFRPKNEEVTELPEQSFHDFLVDKTVSVDGKMSIISLGDVFEFDMEFENGIPTVENISSGTINTGELCIDWYLITNFYDASGAIVYHTEVYVGTTCVSTCPPTELCDELETIGGGFPQLQPAVRNRTLTTRIKDHFTAYEHWSLFAQHNLTGNFFAGMTNLNTFTNVGFVQSVMNYLNPSVNVPGWIHYTTVANTVSTINFVGPAPGASAYYGGTVTWPEHNPVDQSYYGKTIDFWAPRDLF